MKVGSILRTGDKEKNIILSDLFLNGGIMLRVQIGQAEKEFDGINDIDERWINQQINLRREDGLEVCVRVLIKEQDVDIALTTPTCQSIGGSRAPRKREQEIFELWEKRGLRDRNYSGGNLIAFFKQLKNII